MMWIRIFDLNIETDIKKFQFVGGDVPAPDLRTSSHLTLESKTGSASAPVSH
jgi:hypothetical protein